MCRPASRIVNHVDGSRSALRNASPSITHAPPCQRSATAATRPDEFQRSITSAIDGTPSRRASVRPLNRLGPQLWCGEIESYGSATERRYGSDPPHASLADSVRPPEVDE